MLRLVLVPVGALTLARAAMTRILLPVDVEFLRAARGTDECHGDLTMREG